VTEDIVITFGNGSCGKATVIGEVALRTPKADFLLTEVLYIPEASEYLISVRAATQRGLEFKFTADHSEIGQGGQALATAPCHGDAIYYLSGQSPHAALDGSAMVARTKETPELWHKRFGHLGYKNLKRLKELDMVTGITTTAAEFKTAGEDNMCAPCDVEEYASFSV
jgi:hypothetical protein